MYRSSDDDVFADIPPIPRNVSLYEADSGESEEVGYAERTASRNSYEVAIVFFSFFFNF